jgi:hypothetical protein
LAVIQTHKTLTACGGDPYHTRSVPGELDIDDDQSILLADTSTHQPLPQNEELFAVESEDVDGDENEAEGYGDRDILMGNINARQSWADLTDSGEDHLRNGGAAPARRNLSAKAGVILVC